MGYITKICPGLTHHLTILRQIVVGNGAAGCRNCFAVTDTGNIIGVADTGAILGAAGGSSLRHRDYRCTGFPFLIAGDVDCFRLAVSEPCPRYRKRTRRHAHRCCPAPQSRLPGGFIALAGHCKAVVGAWGADRIMTGPQARPYSFV